MSRDQRRRGGFPSFISRPIATGEAARVTDATPAVPLPSSLTACLGEDDPIEQSIDAIESSLRGMEMARGKLGQSLSVFGDVLKEFKTHAEVADRLLSEMKGSAT
jgi:hypothetical protein